MRSPRASTLRAIAVAGAFGATAVAVPAAQAAPNPAVNPGDLVISEFRFHGPTGANDEFVELFNRTTQSIDVNSDEDNSVFWLEYWAPTPEPAGAVQLVAPLDSDIGGRQKFLWTNKPEVGAGYSLDGYAVADVENDVTDVGDVPHNGGVTLYYDPDVTDGINQRTAIDRAGFSTGSGGGVSYFEGVGEPPIAALNTEQYSHVRKFTNVGLPTDTNSNAPDFDLVVTDKTSSYGGQPAIMGAPGPENRAAPYLENDGATAAPNDGMLSALQNPAVSASAWPNREYVGVSGTTPGTLTIRRRVINRTGSPVSELRFRITQLTTYGTAAPNQALLRAIDTNTATVAGEPALGAKLEEPPNQLPDGGGINSSMFVNLAEDPGLTDGVITPGGDVVVTFRFAVDRGGSYLFSYNHEAR